MKIIIKFDISKRNKENLEIVVEDKKRKVIDEDNDNNNSKMMVTLKVIQILGQKMKQIFRR